MENPAPPSPSSSSSSGDRSGGCENLLHIANNPVGPPPPPAVAHDQASSSELMAYDILREWSFGNNPAPVEFQEEEEILGGNQIQEQEANDNGLVEVPVVYQQDMPVQPPAVVADHDLVEITVAFAPVLFVPDHEQLVDVPIVYDHQVQHAPAAQHEFAHNKNEVVADPVAEEQAQNENAAAEVEDVQQQVQDDQGVQPMQENIGGDFLGKRKRV